MQVDVEALHTRDGTAAVQLLQHRLAEAASLGMVLGEEAAGAAALSGIVWTRSMRRMYTLLSRCEEAALTSGTEVRARGNAMGIFLDCPVVVEVNLFMI